MENSYLQIILTAAVPIAELRLAIPLALGQFGLTAKEAYFLSVFGNLLPIIPILLFLDVVSKFLSKHFLFWQKFFDWLFERTRKKIMGHWEVYGCIALVIFVAIPLPLTGAWSGAVAAYILGIPVWRAFFLIALGVAIAGLLVLMASLGVMSVF